MTTFRQVILVLALVCFMVSPGRAQNQDAGSAPDVEALQKRIAALEREIEWTRVQREQMAAYVARQEKDLDALEYRREDLHRFQMELTPYLTEITDRLDRFIQNDLPFLPDERVRRLALVKDALTDYRLDTGEKLRRVMEALRVEAAYGRDVEAGEAAIHLDGQPIQVQWLRLGRIALFYRTPDGRRQGYRTKESGGWIPLPPKYGRSLKKAFEMAQGRRAAELVTLPVRGIGE